jgi:hypothetical protein
MSVCTTAIWGCAPDSFTAGDGGSDATSDSTTVDGGANDGAGDGCTDRWCVCYVTGGTFCDDFDKPGETVGDPTIWSSAEDDMGGTLALDPLVFSSPPLALHAAVPESANNGLEAILLKSVASPSTPLTVSFDLRIGLASCVGNQLATTDSAGAFVLVGTDVTFVRHPEVFAAVGEDSDGNATLFLGIYPSNVQTVAITGLTRDVWMRVELDVATTPSDGGAVLNAAVRLAAVGTPIDRDAAAAAAGAVQLPPTVPLSATWASVGSMAINAAATAPCDVHIDNVVIFQD